jgi:putative transposase
MSLDLSPGTVCVANGQVIEIDGPDSLTHMRARDMASGAIVTVPIARIESLPKTASTAEAGFVSEKEWKRASALAKDLLPLNTRPRVGQVELAKLAKRHGLSIRQLQRLRAAFMANPRTTTLVRNPGGRPMGLNLLTPQVDILIKHAIGKYYFTRQKAPKEYVIVRVESLARRLKLPVPSRGAILTRIAQAVGWAADTARLGTQAAKHKWQPRPGQLVATRPLELIQIDHTPADVLVLSDDRLTVLGRPWVTVAIDVATRCIVGIYVAMHAPSSVSVSLCIEHAVLPKPENAQYPGIWPMYGKPKRILVDNGKDFRALALERGCEEHDIKLTWRPVRTPHYGGHIERMIGTLMKIAHLLPGTTFSNIKEKGDYDSAGQARLTLGEFRQWLVQKICRFYHVRRHRSVGLAPLVAWERGWVDAAGKPMTPALLSHPVDFRMGFLPYVFRTVQRTGVLFNNSRYWHDDLAPMLNRSEQAMVRYDPQDPGQVWIRRPDGVLVTAPAIAGQALGAVPARLAIDQATQQRLDTQLDSGLEATDAIEDQANKATRRARGKSGPAKKKSAPPPTPVSPAHVPPMAARRQPEPVEIWN